ncbi:hypothetical protein [Paenibacillus sp. FSL H3-0333]|uniref:hypothetical protein n=1 Tax=Paenibacillus sp. FSL H3-0333 TaxID=2921373 RepID=UPI0030F5DD98
MINALVSYLHNGTKPIETRMYLIDGVEWEMKIFIGEDVNLIDERIESLSKRQELVNALGF